MTFRRGAQTVTIVRPIQSGAFPRMGDGPADFDRIVVAGCSIYPNTVTETVSRKTGTETITGQDTVVAGLTVLMPPDTDVVSSDLVEVDGTLYDVNGVPSRWKSPATGRRSCVEVQLKTGTG